MKINHAEHLYLSGWKDLPELSVIQNRWLRKYTKPAIWVMLESWVKEQPKGFSLDYLLLHVLESKWDLTDEGWKKAEELGVLLQWETSPKSADTENDPNWMTHGDAARQLEKHTPSKLTFERLKSRITKMANKRKLRTNGETGRKRRFLKYDIDSLELKLRNEDLDRNEYLDSADDDYE